MKKGATSAVGRTFVRILVLGAFLETIWTIYIGVILPRRYEAHHWDLAWVGLDIAQVAMLLGAAWAAWFRRPVLALYATACATLLIMDAWFDITTARRGDLSHSLLLAVTVEIPSALIMLWVALRSLRHSNLIIPSKDGREDTALNESEPPAPIQ